MTVQEVDQVLAFLHEIQLPQEEAFGKVEGAITRALNRIETGAAAVAGAVFEQEAVINDLMDAPDQFAVIREFPQRVIELLTGAGTCTPESAALVGSSCSLSGPDADRDGISDFTEAALVDLGAIVDDVIVIRSVVSDTEGNLDIELVQDVSAYPDLYGLRLDPSNAFTNEDRAGNAIADLDAVDDFVRELDAAHLTLRVITERTDRFLASAEAGLDALKQALVAQAWDVDFDAVAADTGLSVDEARRAVGLFNAYCARCHTSGYSAGVAFEQEPGSGAWGPALTGGRSITQFPNPEDQVEFIIRGSVLAEAYGTNGIGRGWMPGFGQVLSQEDIELIVAFERSL